MKFINSRGLLFTVGHNFSCSLTSQEHLYTTIFHWSWTLVKMRRVKDIIASALCWECAHNQVTFIFKIWNCILVHKFCVTVSRIISMILGKEIPILPELFLLDITGIPKSKATLVSNLITAVIMVVGKHWKAIISSLWRYG